MKAMIDNIVRIIDGISERAGSAVSWLTFVLVFLIFGDVIMRYLFSNTKTWVLELEWHLFAVIFLIGASYTLLHDKHVRVDVFYEKFSKRKKDWVNIIGILLFMIPWTIVIIYYGWDYTMNAWSFKEGSPQPGGLPARYIIKSFIVIGFVMLLLQGLAEVFRRLTHKKE